MGPAVVATEYQRLMGKIFKDVTSPQVVQLIKNVNNGTSLGTGSNVRGGVVGVYDRRVGTHLAAELHSNLSWTADHGTQGRNT